jgi:ribosomal protein S18 acetylase RimI-like enzyme
MPLIRAGDASDLEFLRAMLLEAAYRPGNTRPSVDEMSRTPEIARYIADWGRAGDTAFVAVDEQGRQLGAAWYRLFSPDEPGFGFLDSATPEVSIGVVPSWRGQGIGSALLEALIERARKDGFWALSLSVNPENPAVALYERLGFSRVPSRDEHWTMRLDLTNAPTP